MMTPNAVLLRKHQTRIGWHRPNEGGVAYDQANGMVSFFPSRGGHMMIPREWVAFMKRKPKSAVRKVTRKRTVRRVKRTVRVVRRR